MRSATAKNLLLLTAISCLIGCSNTEVSNPSPSPVFPTCDTLKQFERVPDAVLLQQRETTTVMLKLYDRQAEDEQQKLVKCPR
jgi:hypothetical protein